MATPSRITKIINNLVILCKDTFPNNSKRFNNIVACIVYKKEIISYGFSNKTKTHPFQLDYSIQDRHTLLFRNASEFMNTPQKFSLYTHAETAAIHNALKRIGTDKLALCDMYIARVKKNNLGEFVYGLAKPCGDETKGCTKAIHHFKLKNVYYTTNNNTVELLKKDNCV